jgi:predicted transcriptional regulator YdeE
VLEQLNIEVPGLSINRPQEERRNFRAMRWIVATFILIACLIESSAALAEENHSMPNKTTTETSTDPANKIGDQVSPHQILGVYSDYQSDYTGEYSLSAACQVNNGQGSKPEGMRHGTIPAQTYLMFTGKGAQPSSIIKTWSDIWNYFNGASSGYKRAYTTDFELYKSPEEVEIFIAVKK